MNGPPSPNGGPPPAETDLAFARVDLERARRTGIGEVVYGPGKTPAQLAAILTELHAREGFALATRVSPEQAAFVSDQPATADAFYVAAARVLTLGRRAPDPPLPGTVAVVAAGTSDLPVAEEARAVLEALGQGAALIADVGVAGLHRLTARLEEIRAARVVIVVAGMEGALPSVVAGLVERPVIAAPTSVGYGASFEGLAALLGMLNSCGSGVTVVNIDNGFGAAFAAVQINRLSTT
ncbi:MAG: nickel pincer cofactor biosynthesis protein LarB [Verrucomicrobiota bacterium]